MIDELIETIDTLKAKIAQNIEDNKQYRLDIATAKSNVLSSLKVTDIETISRLYWELKMFPKTIAEAMGVKKSHLMIEPKILTNTCPICDKVNTYTKFRHGDGTELCPCQVEKRIKEENKRQEQWESRNREWEFDQEILDSKNEKLRNMPYQEYLQTPEWKSISRNAMKRAGFKCQLCGAKGIRLNTHHNTYENRGAELLSDLLVLCEECHTDYSFQRAK